MLTMDQQLPQVSLRHRGYPDPGKAIFHHQFQNQGRRSPIMLLLPPILPGDLSRIPDPQLVPTTREQALKPMRIPASFDPYQHRLLQPLVKNPRFLGMQQPAFYQFARFLIQHCDLLEARMKVTTYILHMASFVSSSSVISKSSLLETAGGRCRHTITAKAKAKAATGNREQFRRRAGRYLLSVFSSK